MNIINKTKSFVTMALIAVVTSMFAPVFMSGAFASDKIVLDPDVKNTSVAGSGYSDTNVSNVDLGNTVRFRIKVNNVSGNELDKVTVRANLNKVTGTTKHWTMDAQAEITEGSNTTSTSMPNSVFMNGDWNLEYVLGSTKISTNGADPVAVPDISNTSPMLLTHGYVLNKLAASEQDPQIWLFMDAKVIAGTPVTPQINIQFNKEFMNVTKGSAWSKTVTADAGDVIKARIWFHNGGVSGSSDKPATNVVIKDSMPFNPQNDFVNTATFTANEVGPFVSSAKFTVSSVQGVSYVPGSTNLVVPTSTSNDANVLFDTGRRENIPDVGGLSVLMTQSGFQFGTLQYCWEFQRFVEFQVKVATVTTPGPEVKPAVSLPKTGPEGLVIIGTLSSLITGMYLRKYKFWL